MAEPFTTDPAIGDPIASVIVPAHNEGAVLDRGLRALLDGARPGELDVVVVPNACTDRTAQIARTAGVRVVETDVPGKVHALTLGDAAAVTFPRLYLDADVELDIASVRAIVAALRAPGILAASPRPRFDLTGTGPVVRRSHRVHHALMGSRRGLAGAGIYALDEAGHARAFPLPDVVSDDGWVHGSFDPAERVVVDAARSVVRPARTVRSELDRRVRVRRGNRQLAGLGLRSVSEPLRAAHLGPLVRSRTVGVLDALCYLAVVGTDRVLSRARRRDDVGWAGDPSSRTAAVPSGGSR